MSSIPKNLDIEKIASCPAEKIDELYLRMVKGQGITDGYFYYPDGPVHRYLLLRESELLTAAWDDGTDGSNTSLKNFFDPFLSAPQSVTFAQADRLLVDTLAVSWQQSPEAHSNPGLLDPTAIIESILLHPNYFLTRLRSGSSTTFLISGKGAIQHYYTLSGRYDGAEAEAQFLQDLNKVKNHVSVSVFEYQEPVKSEDWAKIPSDFHEGMVKFYCSTAPHLVLSLSGREITRLPLKPGKITLGRDPANEMAIDNLGISRRHALIEYKNGVCTIQDLGSKNGTMLNGQLVSGVMPFDEKDTINLGKHVVKYVPRAVVQDIAMDMSMLDRTVIMHSPVVTAAENKVAVLTASGKDHFIKSTPFFVGSSSDNALVFDDTGVKPNHALIEKDSGGQYWISHKGGMLATTRINGKKIKSAPLNSGDLIQIGSVMLRFRLENKAESK